MGFWHGCIEVWEDATGYVEDLYKQIFDYCPIDEQSELIEVGIGGGQATLPFLKKNCHVTAIEYGKNLSDICKEKFKDYTGFEVITSRFEDVELKDNVYDLIYSASAFHWIPEDIGYTKVYQALKPGGIIKVYDTMDLQLARKVSGCQMHLID